MFNLIGSIFAKTGAVIGGFFLSIGMFLGGGALPAQEHSLADKVAEVEATTTSTPISNTKSTQIPATPSVPTPITSQSKSPVSLANTPLQILDVEISVDEDNTTISWATTVSTRSRLIVGDKVYESLNGVGTSHKIIMPTEIGNEYSYNITAKSLEIANLEDDIYGSFVALKERTAILGALKYDEESEESCRIFTIKEANGRLSVGTKVSVRGIYQSAAVISYKPYEIEKTDSNGEFKYCYEGFVTKYEISSDDRTLKILGSQ